MLSLYNTLSRKTEVFKPLDDEKVKFYGCGPTVYNYAHIGNLCCYTFEDIIIRSLEFLGYEVDALMNLTDIDDKTIRDSQKEQTTLKAFTEHYTKLFFEDLTKLGITSFKRHKPISELVPEMIGMTQKLIDTKHAYVSDDGSVYFDIKSFKKYGNLAHLDTKGMKAGARVKQDEYEKESVSDFALWKWYDAADGENFWEAHFETKDGPKTLKGRPGWHIECSACNLWWHGEQIDIHMGWVDLIFPHHQNEIAQTEAVTGKTFSTYWMHTGHLLVDGKKMSKSLGNMYRLQDLENEFPNKKHLLYRAFRMMCLQNRYRENFNFTFSRLESAMATIENLDNTLKRLKSYTPRNTKVRREFRDELQTSVRSFVESLENDFDTVIGLTVVFDFIKNIHRDIDTDSLTTKEASSVIELLRSWDAVMGVFDWTILEEKSVPENIEKMAQERQEAKKNKDFARADELRQEIEKLGYTITDSKDGPIIEKK